MYSQKTHFSILENSTKKLNFKNNIYKYFGSIKDDGTFKQNSISNEYDKMVVTTNT